MVKKKGLGKGLEKIFNTEKLELDDNSLKVVDINIKDIKQNPYQPRKTFDTEKMTELQESIEKNGLLQPIIVKKTLKGYYVVAGERRLRAFSNLNKETIPAIAKELTDDEMMIFSVLENLQREDLSALEEALSYKSLAEKLNLTQDDLAKTLGKSRPYVANSLRLLKLPDEVKKYIEDDLLSAGHGRTLLALTTKKQIIDTAKLVIKKAMSVRALEEYVNRINNPETKTKKLKDIFIVEQEKILKKTLGTTVTIKQNKNQKGKIEIEFKNNEEFERIVKLFKEN